MADNSSLAEADVPENTSIDTFNLELEELDDAEYDIPVIDYKPTLESILNDIDDHGSVSEDDASGNHFLPQGEAFETWSMGSVGGRSRSSSERRTIRSSSRSGGSSTPVRAGSILRHAILKAISSQVASASERVGAGLPTAMAVRTMFAVGTSHGLVLVFDASQTLRWCLGSTDQDQGSVSALNFNPDCSRLLVGYARGLILMYDVTTGKLLRTMSDVHPPGTAVLHVKVAVSSLYRDDHKSNPCVEIRNIPTLALCCDSGGSVFELNFKRMMGVRSSTTKCLFSGSRGEVCTMEPLLLNALPSHPLQGSVIIAMATLSKVIVLSIRPRMKVLFTHPLRSDPTTLPLLSWQFVIIQVADDSRVVDPVLAFARESTLHFFQVVVDSWAIRLRPLQRIVVPFIMQSLHWLNPRTLAALDIREQLHLVDVRSQAVLEVTDLAGAGLVYGSSHFKGLATGGNVSEALALAGERACYNSILSFGSQMLVLGTKTVHILSVRTWSERLDHLLRKKQHLDALALGLSIYQDRAKAVVGLKGSHSKKRAIVKEKVLSILNLYIEETLCRAPSVSESLYRQAVPACMGYCVELGALDVMFGQLWEAVSVDRVARGIFLESLEPLILSEALKDVPPAIVQEFVSHYKEAGKFLALEACVVRLDVSRLDLNQLLPLCWLHGLYDAIIYMYTRGMADYTGPLQELIPTLQSALATGKQLTDKLITLGNKLLVYISCCLAGRGYPLGDIAPDQVAHVKNSVFQCVTCLHSVNAAENEPAYPYLRTLLNFDTREFLNVLALAFEEPEFTSELGLRRKQRFVDNLLLLVTPEEGFSASQVGALLTFLARQLAQNDGLQIDSCLFKRVVDFLTQPGAARSQHEERQQALLELMAAGGLDNYEQDQLLAAAEHARFHRVREVLLLQKGNIDLVVDCYLQDQPRRPQVFPFLLSVLAHQESVGLEKRSLLLDAVKKNIKELVELDAQQSAVIVRDNMWSDLGFILEELSPSRLQYHLLKELFMLQDEQNVDSAAPDPPLTEKFIELMCEHEPERVCDFLRTNQLYREDVTIEITRRFSLMEGTAFLLEKSGDFKGAFDLLHNRLEKSLEDLKAEQSKHSAEYSGALSTVQQHVNELLRLCQAGSAVLDTATRQDSLWFPFLRSLLNAHSVLRSEVKPLLQQCLNSMSGFVNLPVVVQLILQDPAYSGATFGEIRDLMMGMLSNCSYEEILVEATSRVLSSDIHQQLARELSLSFRGFGPRTVRGTPSCTHCKEMLVTGSKDEAVIFRCGHSYHKRCLEEPLQCILCDLHSRCVA